ncbi:hypothetical protein CEP12_06605, partial [Cylindrospermopsis raciborskii S14]
MKYETQHPHGSRYSTHPTILQIIVTPTKFPIVKLLSYEAKWSELEESNNPFAIIVMAHLKTKATTRNLGEREKWKWSL